MNSIPKPGILALTFLIASVLTACVAWTERPMGAAAENPVANRIEGQDCRIWDDAQGIPHIRTESSLTSAACMGYVQARDRAWQMDYLRRIAQGRQAEVFGWEALRTDFLMRVLELEKRAAHLFSQLGQQEQELLWAFSYGVNRAFEDLIGRDDRTDQGAHEFVGSSIAVYEFAELNYRPEQWHPSHTLAILLLQAFDQTRRSFEHELQEAAWVSRHGEGADSLFHPEDLPWDTTILKKGEYEERTDSPGSENTTSASTSTRPAPVNPETGKKLTELLAALPRVSGSSAGSNSWVVAPGRSETGKAWLANDPHLDLKSPPFWHWSHVSDSTGLDAIGAAVPGVPVIVSGANRGMAWGLTNSYIDVADLHVVPEKDLLRADSYRPVIWFRWWKFRLPYFFKTFRRTSEGWPVLPLEAPEDQAIVLRWTGFTLRSTDIEPMLRMMHAKDVPDMDRLLSEVGLPSWNFVFADSSGRIAYRTIGRSIRRELAPPFGLSPSGRGGLLNPPVLNADEMPHLLDPERGYIVTANNPQWRSTGVFHLGRAHTPSFRAFRIEELLTSKERHGFASNRAAQCDVQAVDARFLLPELVRTVAEREESSPHLDVREKAVLVRLAEWDYEASLGCEPCAVYRLWVDRLKETADLNEAALYRKLVGEDETITAAAEQAFLDALDALGVNERGELLPWGQLHKSRFPHLARPAGEQHEGVPTPGDTHTVNPGTMDGGFNGEIFEHTGGASHRLLVELTSPPVVHAQLAGPNPDVPQLPRISPDSPWIQWAQCRYEKRIFPLDWDSVESETLSF